MTQYAEEYEDSENTSNNVIPFPQGNTSSTTEHSIESLLFKAIASPKTEARLKGLMEAAVLDAWMKTRLLDMELVDDPFDAIYISELRADPIAPADIKRIQSYSDVVDLSNTISFEDEWED
jgi:hypothetical protein